MTPFVKASVPIAEIERTIVDMMTSWRNKEPVFMALIAAENLKTDVEVLDFITKLCLDESQGRKLYLNDTYQVSVRGKKEDRLIHLSIKRIDREAIHDWRHLQQIKNALVGPEHEAVELYPAESRLVDTANQYHLFCVNDPTYRFPFGFSARAVGDKAMFGKSKQRPLEATP